MEHKISRIWSHKEIPFPPPNPLPIKECACGCGYTFQPRRRDQIYLCSTHANYGYNHGKRKEKNKKKIEVNRLLANNERILEKYFNNFNGNPTVALLLNLKADGFNSNLYLSINNQNKITYYYLYNYGFSIYTEENQTLVKIYKLSKNESI
jgi:hypothetical protein